MARKSMKEEAWNALILPPIGVLSGMMLILMGMNGGSVFFVLAAVTILLLIYLPKLIRGGLGRYGGGAAIRSFFAVMTLVSLALTALLGFGWYLIAMNPPQLVPKSGEGNCATRIEFHFPGKTRVVHDPYRQLVFCRGASPPEVRKDPDGTVVAVFRGGAGSLDTWWDSAGISESGFKFGGWMGVRLGEDEIVVTKEGTFDGVNRNSGKAVMGEPIFRPHTRGY
jgi:hypothetical protein